MLWREGTVCVIVRRDAESARVRVLSMLLTGEAGRSRAEPSGGEQSRAALLSDERGRAGPSDVERSRADLSGGAQHSNITTTDTATSGVLDFGCIAATH